MSKIFKFGIELENNQTAKDYLNKVAERLKSSDISKNPYYGEIFTEIKNDKIRAFFNLSSIYPNPVIFVIFSWIGVLLLTGFKATGWLIIPSLFSITLLTQTNWFYYAVIAHGLTKVGYLSKFRRLKYDSKWDNKN